MNEVQHFSQWQQNTCWFYFKKLKHFKISNQLWAYLFHTHISSIVTGFQHLHNDTPFLFHCKPRSLDVIHVTDTHIYMYVCIYINLPIKNLKAYFKWQNESLRLTYQAKEDMRSFYSQCLSKITSVQMKREPVQTFPLAVK